MLIRTRRNSAAERRTRDALERLMQRHVLARWTWTDDVLIDERAHPHSHPTLTLDTDYADDPEFLLAGYVHEQLHWFEESRAVERDAALAELAVDFADVPVERPDGAGSTDSTRLHLVVCHLEHEAMRELLGPDGGDAVVTRLAAHHYRWVYRTVLSRRTSLAEVVRRHGLVPDQP